MLGRVVKIQPTDDSHFFTRNSEVGLVFPTVSAVLFNGIRQIHCDKRQIMQTITISAILNHVIINKQQLLTKIVHNLIKLYFNWT